MKTNELVQQKYPYTLPTTLALVLVTFTLSGLLFSSCDSGGGVSGENGANDPESLVPIQAGYQWVGVVTGSNYDLVATAETASEIDLEVRDGSDVLLSSTLLVQQSDEGLLLAQTSGGVVAGREINRPMLFKYPIDPGSSYQYENDKGNEYLVSVSETSISVPAGSYSGCLRYDIAPLGTAEVVTAVWFKPGLGVVKVDIRPGSTGSRLSTSGVELSSVSLD